MMDRGTTLKFEIQGKRGQAGNEGGLNWEFVPNILGEEAGLVQYADEALEAAGFLHVSKAPRNLDIWETPDGPRPHSVFFLFRATLSHPLASATTEEPLTHLMNALRFIESDQVGYLIKEREAPLPS